MIGRSRVALAGEIESPPLTPSKVQGFPKRRGNSGDRRGTPVTDLHRKPPSCIGYPEDSGDLANRRTSNSSPNSLVTGVLRDIMSTFV